jgi:adenylate kinase family enzyme
MHDTLSKAQQLRIQARDLVINAVEYRETCEERFDEARETERRARLQYDRATNEVIDAYSKELSNAKSA